MAKADVRTAGKEHMTSIACHYIARAARLSPRPHQPASTIQAKLQSEPDHGSAFVRSPRIKAGCGFLLSVDLETVSRSESIFWDAVSAAHPIRKACPSIWPQTGARFPDGSRRRPSQTGSLASRHPRHPPERATLAASMPPRTARPRARRSQTNFKRTRVGHAAFLATYRPVLAGRSLGGH